LTHILNTPQEIVDIAREKGFWHQANVNLTKQEFFEFCSSVTTPWSAEIHKIHTETLNEDQVVDWSSKTRFGSMSIPWHADNPWHEKYRFPLRAFYAVDIPDPNDGEIYFLNITKWFEDQPDDTKEYLRSLQVLTQDYKNGCQPFWSSFIKTHPITGKESFYWGAMRVDSKVFGLAPDEGVPAPRFSFTMAIQKPNRDLVLDDEISSWFNSMMTYKYLHRHNWNNGDLLILDNWVNLHYRGTIKDSRERLLWRKTLLQPWQTI